MATRLALLLTATLWACTGTAAADPKAPPSPSPEDAWSLELHTGALWSIGSNASPIDYVMLPQLLTLKTPAHWSIPLDSGDLVVRSRASFEATPIVQGPESYFIGLTLAPSIEYWNSSRSISFFFSAGGGAGFMDSQGQMIPGAQGQDFNLTWFVHTGLTWQLTPHLSASLGARFQHISNGGQNEINPGIDSLGPTLGLGWNW
jgi:lipid A 3-O-deacylase